jgi:hypothetical protein
MVALVLSCGCGGAGAPNCGDKQATDLVKEIANTKLRDLVVLRTIVTPWG